MLIEIFDIEPLKNFFNLIYDSATIVELKLDQEKLSISLLNNSHVAFYSLEIAREFFGDYSIQDNESILIFVEDFYKIIKTAKKDDVLLMKSDDAYLDCTFEHDGNRRVFEIPLAEDYGDSPMLPMIDYPVDFVVSLSDLKQPCEDLDKIVKTDRFKMEVEKGFLNVVSPDDAMTKYENSIITDNDYERRVSSTFNIQYILSLQKLSKISKEVLFKVGDDIPLTWIMTSPDEMVKVSGLIAPIMQED